MPRTTSGEQSLLEQSVLKQPVDCQDCSAAFVAGVRGFICWQVRPIEDSLLVVAVRLELEGIGVGHTACRSRGRAGGPRAGAHRLIALGLCDAILVC